MNPKPSIVKTKSKGKDVVNSQKYSNAQLELLALMYFAYAATMIMKYTIIVVSPLLISDPMIAITKTQFGEILASGSIGGIFGKILYSLGADRFAGREWPPDCDTNRRSGPRRP
ncbi:MAG: hypothetical protein E2O35_04550 [Proteobacteria bacterium]|nr:MAG: hypothetical protein E2O35_04550 [Pseudomonadota bacterium]